MVVDFLYLFLFLFLFLFFFLFVSFYFVIKNKLLRLLFSFLFFSIFYQKLRQSIFIQKVDEVGCWNSIHILTNNMLFFCYFTLKKKQQTQHLKQNVKAVTESQNTHERKEFPVCVEKWHCSLNFQHLCNKFNSLYLISCSRSVYSHSAAFTL